MESLEDVTNICVGVWALQLFIQWPTMHSQAHCTKWRPLNTVTSISFHFNLLLLWNPGKPTSALWAYHRRWWRENIHPLKGMGPISFPLSWKWSPYWTASCQFKDWEISESQSYPLSWKSVAVFLLRLKLGENVWSDDLYLQQTASYLVHNHQGCTTIQFVAVVVLVRCVNLSCVVVLLSAGH